MSTKEAIPYTGCILISNPFLDDPYFSRTVVLLLAHNQEGSFGVILNQKTNYEISFSQTEKSPHLPIWFGGPVQPEDAFVFVHKASFITDAQPIFDGWYHGGTEEQLMKLLPKKILNAANTRVFKGYSGWESEQLQGEINNQQWIVTPAKDEYLAFHHSDLWQHIIDDIGGNLSVVAKAAEKIKLN